MVDTTSTPDNPGNDWLTFDDLEALYGHCFALKIIANSSHCHFDGRTIIHPRRAEELAELFRMEGQS